jgi:hypothetical protein
MTIAWMGFAAIAIFMARYMRNVWEEEKLLGQKVWFTVGSFDRFAGPDSGVH